MLALVAALMCGAGGSALATSIKPKAGCWGLCGGDGSAGAKFYFEKGKVVGFTYGDKCLGVLEPYALDSEVTLDVPSTENVKLPVGNGAFSFKGKAYRLTAEATSSAPAAFAPIEIELKGRFLSPTKASASLSFAHGSCGKKHLTITYL